MAYYVHPSLNGTALEIGRPSLVCTVHRVSDLNHRGGDIHDGRHHRRPADHFGQHVVGRVGDLVAVLRPDPESGQLTWLPSAGRLSVY